MVAGEKVLTAPWSVVNERRPDLVRLVGGEPQSGVDTLEDNLPRGSGQHLEPLLHQEGFLRAGSNPRQLRFAIAPRAGAFRPEPGGRCRAKHVKDGASDAPDTPGVKQVVDRVELASRNPKPQDRSGLPVFTGSRLVGNNLGLSRQKLAEFGDLVLQKRRFTRPRSESQLDIAPCWSAI